MNEPTKEQIKWFWEQCGFEYDDDWADDRPYKDPEGTILHNWKGADLKNLFKYDMSRLDQAQYYKALSSIFLKSDNPALALFWARYTALGGK